MSTTIHEPVVTTGVFELDIDELPVKLPDGWYPRNIRQVADVVKTARTTGSLAVTSTFVELDGTVLTFAAKLNRVHRRILGERAVPTAEIAWTLTRPTGRVSEPTPRSDS